MSPTTTSGGADDRAPRVVTVVEDDADLREAYATYLEGEGFTAVRATNGVEALLQIERRRPVSVVLDLLLPRLGGLELLRRIRAFDPSIVVVVVTGAVDPDLRRQALALGARAVLEKPVALETLLAALTQAPPSSPAVSAPPKAVAAAPPGLILVVDDEPDVRTLLEDYLTPKGYRVRSVVNGAAALREVIDEAPDVVLLDVDMPRFGGLEALAGIRRLAPQVKVIMISGKASLETAQKALAHGAFDYISKPFDLDRVSEVVAAALLWEE